MKSVLSIPDVLDSANVVDKNVSESCKRPTNILFWSWFHLVLVQFSGSLLPVLELDFQTLGEEWKENRGECT